MTTEKRIKSRNFTISKEEELLNLVYKYQAIV